MIDFDKLKLAHELCFDTDYIFNIEFGWEDSFEVELSEVTCRGHEFISSHSTLDRLIFKLRELTEPKTEPKPKYEVGQQIWVIHPIKSQPWIDEVIQVRSRGNGFQYVLTAYAFYECDVYPSRRALIDAQVEYWSNLSYMGSDDEPKSSCCSVHAGSSEALRDYQAMNLAWVANLVRKTSLENRSVHAGTSEECR